MAEKPETPDVETEAAEGGADEPKAAPKKKPAAKKPAAKEPAAKEPAAKEPAAKKAPAKKAPAKKKAAGTAAEETGVEKDAAAAAKKPTAKKATDKKATAEQTSTATKGKASAKSDPKTGEKSKPEATPRNRRGRRTESGVVVRAQAKYVRSSARKARLVCDQIRGKSVPEARALLAFSPRDVAEAWTKVLDSAVANAENNHDLDGDELRVLAVYADEGPTIKRFRPRAMGRATAIRKRTSHLTIQLAPKE